MNAPALHLVPAGGESLPSKQQAELLHLRRIARTASALLNAPYLDDHQTTLAELLTAWRRDHRGS